MIEIDNLSDVSKIVNSKSSVLLDFWAPWCGPCKAIMPMLEKLSEDYSDVTFAKINVEDNKDIVDHYKVSSVPSLVFIKNGKIEDTQVGVKSQSFIEEKINSIID